MASGATNGLYSLTNTIVAASDGLKRSNSDKIVPPKFTSANPRVLPMADNSSSTEPLPRAVQALLPKVPTKVSTKDKLGVNKSIFEFRQSAPLRSIFSFPVDPPKGVPPTAVGNKIPWTPPLDDPEPPPVFSSQRKQPDASKAWSTKKDSKQSKTFSGDPSSIIELDGSQPPRTFTKPTFDSGKKSRSSSDNDFEEDIKHVDPEKGSKKPRTVTEFASTTNQKQKDNLKTDELKSEAEKQRERKTNENGFNSLEKDKGPPTYMSTQKKPLLVPEFPVGGVRCFENYLRNITSVQITSDSVKFMTDDRGHYDVKYESVITVSWWRRDPELKDFEKEFFLLLHVRRIEAIGTKSIELPTHASPNNFRLCINFAYSKELEEFVEQLQKKKLSSNKICQDVNTIKSDYLNHHKDKKPQKLEDDFQITSSKRPVLPSSKATSQPSSSSSSKSSSSPSLASKASARLSISKASKSSNHSNPGSNDKEDDSDDYDDDKSGDFGSKKAGTSRSSSSSYSLRNPRRSSDHIVLDDEAEEEPTTVSVGTVDEHQLLNALQEPLFVYPFNGIRAVPVTEDDVSRLEKDEFLNDSLLDFYFKYLQDKIDDDFKPLIQVYNTFFFQYFRQMWKKAKKSSDRDTTVYEAMKRWSKDDLFSKTFVFIPINEHLHWYLALIAYPQRLLDLARKSSQTQAADDVSIKSTDDNEDDEEFETLSSQVDTKELCQIMILDSLGSNRPHILQLLCEFLRMQLLGQHNIKLDIKQINKMTKKKFPKVPQQTNHSDCGLYVLHFVEKFIWEDKIDDIDVKPKPIDQSRMDALTQILMSKEGDKNWFKPAEANNKRDDLKVMIVKLKSVYDEYVKTKVGSSKNVSPAASSPVPDPIRTRTEASSDTMDIDNPPKDLGSSDEVSDD